MSYYIGYMHAILGDAVQTVLQELLLNSPTGPKPPALEKIPSEEKMRSRVLTHVMMMINWSSRCPVTSTVAEPVPSNIAANWVATAPDLRTRFVIVLLGAR
jgi:hypothetical protein